MVLLEDRENPGNGWVARADDGSQEGRGVAEWLINPHLKTMFQDYRRAVVEVKMERAHDWRNEGKHGDYHEVRRPLAIRGHELLTEPNVT